MIPYIYPFIRHLQLQQAMICIPIGNAMAEANNRNRISFVEDNVQEAVLESRSTVEVVDIEI